MKEYIENVLAPKLQGDGGWSSSSPMKIKN